METTQSGGKRNTGLAQMKGPAGIRGPEGKENRAGAKATQKVMTSNFLNLASDK